MPGAVVGMAAKSPCPKCGSDQVIPDGEVKREHGISRGIEVRVKNDPERVLLTMTATAALHARICVDCGHVELYVSDLASMRGVHRERSKRDSSV